MRLEQQVSPGSRQNGSLTTRLKEASLLTKALIVFILVLIVALFIAIPVAISKFGGSRSSHGGTGSKYTHPNDKSKPPQAILDKIQDFKVNLKPDFEYPLLKNGLFKIQ